MNIASIDIGTNTVLMLIANINKADKKIIPVVNKYRMPRIGKGLHAGFPISQDRIEALFDVLKEYNDLIQHYNCSKILAVGTSALRTATNSKEICDEIKNRFNIEVRIISGMEEAETSYLGSVSGFSHQDLPGSFLVIDIGGGSTEIISGTDNLVKYSKSFQAGVVSLSERILRHDPPLMEELVMLEKEIDEIFNELKGLFPEDKTVIAVAGTPTSLSCIKQDLKEYDEEKVEGSTLNLLDFKGFIPMLSQMTHRKILETYNEIVNGREDIILTGTVLLYMIMKLIEADQVIVSGRGIRFGSIIKYLNE